MKIDYRNIDFMVFLPCPMKAAFGKIANQLVQEFERETGEHIRFLPVSAMDEEMARDFLSIQRAEDYPAVMMVPGFGFPYAQSFMKRFRSRDCFESILPDSNPLFQKYGLYDPEHIYDIVGLSSIAFFLDRSYHPELEPPTSWHKLLFDEQYVRTVGMPGREDSGFQDFPIMAAYQLFGMEGVERLARTAKTCLIPAEMVRMAVRQIGYTREYQERWGLENTICADDIVVAQHVTRQSPDIAQGVDRDGWGDQGIFWGMAVDNPLAGYMPADHHLARFVGESVFRSRLGGLDIKTQVAMDGNRVRSLVAAVPQREEDDESRLRAYLASLVPEGTEIILNGTGRYVTHGPIGDCGTTGRKLAVDFYGGNCRLGGGSFLRSLLCLRGGLLAHGVLQRFVGLEGGHVHADGAGGPRVFRVGLQIGVIGVAVFGAEIVLTPAQQPEPHRGNSNHQNPNEQVTLFP